MAVLLWGSVDEERCWGAGRGPRDEEEMESKGRNGAAEELMLLLVLVAQF